jgi:glucan phosphorylase
LIGRGALLLSKKLERKPDIAILSETPTTFVHHKLVNDELKQDPFFANTKYIFNDHTPLEYAHPIWDANTLQMVKMDPEIYTSSPGWSPSKKTLDVTSLLVGVCDGVYGVAKKHAEVMRAMPSLKMYGAKIRHVTNGVRVADWQAPEFQAHAFLTDDQLIQAKRNRKKILLDWAWRHCRLYPAWAAATLDKKVVIWTRRITPYKRLDVLVKLLKNPVSRERFLKLNVTILFGGRIHQQDNHAQDIVYELLDMLEKDAPLQQRVVPVDNFNVWEAPLLFQGTDAAIMLADDTREASATGFMKAQMNGAAIIATADGAVPEFVFQPDNLNSPFNGFNVPYVNGEPTSSGFLEALEQFDRAFDDPKTVAMVMRSALFLTEKLSTHRTVEEMKNLYAEILNVPVPTQPA